MLLDAGHEPEERWNFAQPQLEKLIHEDVFDQLVFDVGKLLPSKPNPSAK